MVRSTRRRLAILGTVACLASAVACADDSSPASSPLESSPFTVGYLPAGFEPVAVGEGSWRLAWGDDSEGTNAPLTVLERGDGEDREPILVTFFGYEGTQQESPLRAGDDHDPLEVDGHQGTFRRASEDNRWSSLVVDFGDDLAVRVASPHASEGELLEVLAAVQIPNPSDETAHVAAPVVDPLPEGVRHIGFMDARAVLAQDSYVWGSTDEVPGPPESHTATWVGEGADLDRQLVVQTLPGDVADLAGIAGAVVEEGMDGRIVDVDGRPAAVVEPTGADDDSLRHRAVWLISAWGDLVHVVSRGSTPLPLEEVAAIANAVERATAEGWAAVVDDVMEGGRLRPDVGWHTVASGEIEGTGWLLQGTRNADVDLEPGSGPLIDDCFKLSTGERDCAMQFSVGALIDTTGTSGRTLPLFVVTTVRDTVAVRLTTGGDSIEAPARHNSALGIWVAVFEVAHSAPLRCEPDASTRLEAIDEQGNVVRCLAPS